MDISDVDADFYLCMAEGAGEPRACWIKARVPDPAHPERDDCALVGIEPPVIGQPYGLGAEDIFLLLLASKWDGHSLWPVSRWPAPVYVLRSLSKSILHQTEVDHTQTEIIDWGMLHRTYKEAQRDRFPT